MSFRLIYELAAPRRPDLDKVRKQVEIFGPVVDAFFVPDNHLGLPAMSSVALSIEIAGMGFDVIAGINARDRNELRLISDLVTLEAYGIKEVVFLYGDKVPATRAGLTVKAMLGHPAAQGFSKGVAAEIGRPLGWKEDADFLMTQLAFERGKAGYWREAFGFRHPVYCGVIAIQDREMAKRVLGNIPGLVAPDGYLDSFERDPEAGFIAALNELEGLRRNGIDGAQIVVPFGWKRFAELLSERT